jgi:histidinol phosphatase-like PHP family hydrolase
MELFSINSKKGALNSQPQVIKLAHGRWFSLSTPASSTTKTGRYEIAEILLKVALNTKNQSSINYP